MNFGTTCFMDNTSTMFFILDARKKTFKIHSQDKPKETPYLHHPWTDLSTLYDKLIKFEIAMIQTTSQTIKTSQASQNEPPTKPFLMQTDTPSHAKISTNIISAKPNAI